MKLIYSLVLLAIASLVVNKIALARQPIFSASEMREINRRLKYIGTL